MEISPVACASAFGLAVILRQRNRTAHKSRRSRKRRTRGGAASKHDRKLRSRFVHARDNDAPGFTRSGNLYFNSHEAENRQRRRIECADIFAWLQAHPQLPGGTSVVVSLPDLSELDPAELQRDTASSSISGMNSSAPPSLSEDDKVRIYVQWFEETSRRLLAGLAPGQFAIFYQSDTRIFVKPSAGSSHGPSPGSSSGPSPDRGTAAAPGSRSAPKEWCAGLVHKVGLVARAADALGRDNCSLLWHKVFTFNPLGAGARMPMSVGRPQCSHMVCYGKRGPGAEGASGMARPHFDPCASLAPDVLERGPQLWSRGMGLAAAHVAADFLAHQPHVHTVFNPCCGVGTVVGMAVACGLDAVGLDNSRRRCEQAAELRLRLDEVIKLRVDACNLPAPRASFRGVGMEDTAGAATTARSAQTLASGQAQKNSPRVAQAKETVSVPRVAVGIVRHSIRLDNTEGATWPDSAARPFDTPISDRLLPTEVAASLRRHNFRRIRASPMRRCVETAAVLARALGVKRIELDYALSEMMPKVRQAYMQDTNESHARAWAPLPRDVIQNEINAMGTGAFVEVGELEGERPAYDEGHEGALRRFSTAIDAVRKDACNAGGPVLLVTHGDCVNAAKYALADSVEIFDVQECGWVLVGIDGALLDHGRVQLLQM